MESDLTDAFRYYDKEGMDYVSMPHFKNILHNFGFQNKQAKEQQEELRKNDPEIVKRQGVCLPETKFFVGYRWNKAGKEDEARRVIASYHPPERAEAEVEEIRSSIAQSKSRDRTPFHILFHPTVLRLLGIGLIVAIAQQCACWSAVRCPVCPGPVGRPTGARERNACNPTARGCK